MQCTGLLANSSYRGESEEDRLIYEGDIVEVSYTLENSLIGKRRDIYAVEFTNNSLVFNFRLYDILYDCESFADNVAQTYHLYKDAGYKIIGNIHEHPELLAQTK